MKKKNKVCQLGIKDEHCGGGVDEQKCYWSLRFVVLNGAL